MSKKILLFVMLAFAVFACKNGNAVTEENTQTNDGLVSTFPADNQDIEVYNIEGLEKLMSQKDDKIHVINFWATWCVPCIKELPYFEQVNEEMDDVKMTLVSIDEEKIIESRVVPFVNKKGLKSDVSVVLYEKDTDLIESVSDTWGGSIPATLIYNKHKSYFIEGSLTYDELVTEIEKFKS